MITKKIVWVKQILWILPHHELLHVCWGAFGSNKCPVGSLSTKTGTPPAVGRGPKQSTEGAGFFFGCAVGWSAIFCRTRGQIFSDPKNGPDITARVLTFRSNFAELDRIGFYRFLSGDLKHDFWRVGFLAWLCLCWWWLEWHHHRINSHWNNHFFPPKNRRPRRRAGPSRERWSWRSWRNWRTGWGFSSNLRSMMKINDEHEKFLI